MEIYKTGDIGHVCPKLLVRKKSFSNMNRQKIADIIDRQSHTDWICTVYDWFMVLAILVSLLPLMFMKPHKVFWYTELGSVLVFIIDYVLRWGTADIRHNNRKTAFLTYPFSFMAIIDLLSILPAVTLSPEEEKKAALILNSINNIKKSRFFLSKHKLICSYLDNDEGGKWTFGEGKGTVLMFKTALPSS